MPYLFLLGKTGGGVPGRHQAEKLLGRRHVRGFPRLAVAFHEFAPLRPLQLVLAGGDEFIGRHIRRRDAVGQARPDGHLGIAGKHPVAEDIALRRPGQHLDPDFQPRVVDQFQDIGDFRFFARRIDSNDRRTAIGQQADAVAVFLVQPHLIEQPVGPCQVEAGPPRPVFGPEQGAFLDDRVIAAPGQPEISDLVDFVAVDGQRQGAAEPHVPEDFSPHRVLGVEVGVNGDMGPLHRAPQVDRLVVTFLAFLQEGVVFEGDVAALKVGFPGPGLSRDQVAKADVHDHPVDVGKLAPGGVDAVEERIAHEHEPLRGRFGGVHPRLQRRHFRIIQGIHAVLGLMQHRPVHETRFFGHLFQLCAVRIAGVKPLHVVGRAIDE